MSSFFRPIGTFLAKHGGRVFFVCVLAQLLPVVAFGYLPIADGPIHVYNARLLLSYLAENGAALGGHYELNPAPVPNWLSHVLLAAGMSVLSPVASEKLVLGIYVLLLPLAMRYALRSQAHDTHGLEFLIFPFIFN
ncbi:MAG: hypothetical protein L0Y64_10340, partial [Myxococcaceae bacterium]|nr:hypothetical protein [Myxococcaceae bacterium]